MSISADSPIVVVDDDTDITFAVVPFNSPIAVIPTGAIGPQGPPGPGSTSLPWTIITATSGTSPVTIPNGFNVSVQADTTLGPVIANPPSSPQVGQYLILQNVGPAQIWDLNFQSISVPGSEVAIATWNGTTWQIIQPAPIQSLFATYRYSATYSAWGTIIEVGNWLAGPATVSDGNFGRTFTMAPYMAGGGGAQLLEIRTFFIEEIDPTEVWDMNLSINITDLTGTNVVNLFGDVTVNPDAPTTGNVTATMDLTTIEASQSGSGSDLTFATVGSTFRVHSTAGNIMYMVMTTLSVNPI